MIYSVSEVNKAVADAPEKIVERAEKKYDESLLKAVSYTHLTLPTIA